MSVLGLIPARAGSKRLAGKNLLPLDGRPLLGYTCAAARDSGIFSAIYINTDSPDIVAVARDHGVACPVLRPPELAGDDTPTRVSNLFVLEWLARCGERYDAVAVLQPTSPLRTAADIRDAWAVFEEHAPCAVVSVAALVPESWAGRIGRDGSFERNAGDGTMYRLNGAIYVYRWEDYLEDRPPRKTVAYVMPAARSIDIDTRQDLAYAEFLLRRQRHGPEAQVEHVDYGCPAYA